MQATHPGVAEQDRVELVGYHDLDRRPAFKIAMQEIGGRWFVHLSHFWHSGRTVVDVTDPSNPQMVRFVEGPPNTETTQIQVAEGRMLVSLERPLEEVYGKVEGYDSGIEIYDDTESDPSTPCLLGSWKGDSERLGAMPRGRLVCQTEDVVIDARGYMYCTDKNQGLFILRYEGEVT